MGSRRTGACLGDLAAHHVAPVAPPAEMAKKQHLVPEWHAKGYAALGVMEQHLAKRDWFAGGRFLGSSAPARPLLWAASPGTWTLRAVDESGRSATCHVRVERVD